MAIWRPSKRILVKVLGLAWHEGRLLATEIAADNGEVTGVRPSAVLSSSERRESKPWNASSRKSSAAALQF